MFELDTFRKSTHWTFLFRICVLAVIISVLSCGLAQAQFDSIVRGLANGAGLPRLPFGLSQPPAPRPEPSPYPTSPVPFHPAPSPMARVSPSFDCHQATSSAEREICARPDLATLDVEVTRAFKTARSEVGPTQASALAADERGWLRRRNACGASASCLRRSMHERLDQLASATPVTGPPTGQVAGAPTVAAPVSEPAILGSLPPDLRRLRLPVHDGMPIVGLNAQSASDEPALFRLLALDLDPGLIAATTPNDNARQFANDFLARPSRYLDIFGDWTGRDEFQRAESRQAFLAEVGPRLRRLAPPLPFRFLYATRLALGPYDAALGGFPLAGSLSLGGPTFGPLKLVPDFRFPAMFVSIDEAGARALVARLDAAQGRLPGNPRDVELAAVIEASAGDPGAMELHLHLQSLTLYDRDLKQSLFVFRQPGDAAPPASDLLARLTQPAAGIMPLHLATVDGVPLLQPDQAGAAFTTLLALGAMPRLLEPGPQVDQRDVSMAEERLATTFLTPAARTEVVAGRPTMGGAVPWKGEDEFARGRSQAAFERDFMPKLRAIAPHVPFEFAFANTVELPDYDRARGGFALRKLTGLQPSQPETLPPARVPGVPGDLRWVAQFAPPELFWRIDPAEAEQLVEQLRRAAAKANRFSTENGRWLSAVMLLRAARLDPASGERSGAIELQLKQVVLYTRDLHTRLHAFAPAAPEVAPFLTATVPDRLEVASPAPLDATLIDLKLVQALGARTPEGVLDGLWQIIAQRDQVYYAQATHPALSPADARRPFFPRGGAVADAANKAVFVRWARAYAAGLPDQAESPPASAWSSGGEDMVVPAVSGGAPSQYASYQGFLREKGLQQDQVAVGEGVLRILPNRVGLYSVRVTAAMRAAYPGRSPTATSLFRVGAAQLLDGASGRDGARVAIALEPLSTTVSMGDTVIARRSYADIPHLDGTSFLAPPSAAPAPDTVLPMDAALIDMLSAKALGDRLSPEAQAYMVLRRWQAENASGAVPGGRFFALGKRQPSPEEAGRLGKAFLAWAAAHAPSFPALVTVSGEMSVEGQPTTAPWSVMRCFGLETRVTTLHPASFQSFDCDRQKAGAASGRQSWLPQDEQRCAAVKLTDAVAGFQQSFWNGCGPHDPMLSFVDPAKFRIQISQALPLPTLPRALGGQQKLTGEATLAIDGVHGSNAAPIAADMLPEDVRRLFDARRSAPPGQDGPGEYVVLDASFRQVRYRDADGAVSTLGPASGESVAGLVAAFRQSEAAISVAPPAPRPAAQAALRAPAVPAPAPVPTAPRAQADVASPGAPQFGGAVGDGPYGPDMDGIRLGMSLADAERVVRAEMKVGHVLTPASGKLEISGKLFISQDGTELIALMDSPPGAADRVTAAWRKLYVPPSVTLEAVLGKLRGKYGPPVFRAAQDTLQLWGKRESAMSCALPYMTASYAGTPIGGVWTEAPGGVPWQPVDGEVRPTAPGYPGPLKPNLVSSAALCGPYLTMRFLPAQGMPAMNVIETTLTDVGREVQAHSRTQTAPGSVSTNIKF